MICKNNIEISIKNKQWSHTILFFFKDGQSTQPTNKERKGRGKAARTDIKKRRKKREKTLDQLTTVLKLKVKSKSNIHKFCLVSFS